MLAVGVLVVVQTVGMPFSGQMAYCHEVSPARGSQVNVAEVSETSADTVRGLEHAEEFSMATSAIISLELKM